MGDIPQNDALACSKAIQNVKNILITQNNVEEHQDLTSDEPPQPSVNDLWTDHYKLVNANNFAMNQVNADNTLPMELNYYLKSPIVDLKVDPLEWWTNDTNHPKLKNMALKYLSCTATSTASERLFSKAGFNLYQQRNRLIGKLLSKILFMQSVDKKYWDV